MRIAEVLVRRGGRVSAFVLAADRCARARAGPAQARRAVMWRGSGARDRVTTRRDHDGSPIAERAVRQSRARRIARVRIRTEHAARDLNAVSAVGGLRPITWSTSHGLGVGALKSRSPSIRRGLSMIVRARCSGDHDARHRPPSDPDVAQRPDARRVHHRGHTFELAMATPVSLCGPTRRNPLKKRLVS
jgi:hypothetical protein